VRYSGIVALTLLAVAAFGDSKPTLRWAEGGANCTYRVADDGHVYYGISSADFDITLAVDRQEMEKVRHRAIPVVGVFLSFRYKGGHPLPVSLNEFTLEFVNHHHVVQQPLAPDSLVKELDSNADDLTHYVEHHEIRSHPEEKDKKEAELGAHLHDYSEMKDFVSTHALHQGTLNRGNSSVSGWVFFSTEDRWIGALHRQEKFILRLPAGGWMVEFPFELPAKGGTMELRRRPAKQ
jgi:hypothetical protein